MDTHEFYPCGGLLLYKMQLLLQLCPQHIESYIHLAISLHLQVKESAKLL